MRRAEVIAERSRVTRDGYSWDDAERDETHQEGQRLYKHDYIGALKTDKILSGWKRTQFETMGGERNSKYEDL